jgi:hypothetical protein
VTSDLVVALLADGAPASALAAGFEEEGVPLSVRHTPGEAAALAREAAGQAVLGLGIGGDETRLVLVLAAAPGRPYLQASATRGRSFAQAAARVAARRPLRHGYE